MSKRYTRCVATLRTAACPSILMLCFKNPQTFRAAAKNGSGLHISKVSQLMPKLPASYVADAVAILCAALDVPAFPPEKPLPSSLSSTRSIAIASLLGLAGIPESALSDEQYTSHRILERNWPMICNWMQYFHHELIMSRCSESSSRMVATTAIPTIIAKIACQDEVFARLVINDDNILNLIIKIWLMPEVFLANPLPHASRHYESFGLLHQSIAILISDHP